MAGDDAPVEDPYAPGELPVLRYAEEILQAVRTNPTTVVIGETGSGKTTQISQILHRASATLMPDSRMGVAITQPRRVAAVSVARRVAHEMGVKIGTLVGYTVRFEDCSSRETRIKYMTDGTLLRECLEDPNLSKYGVIVLDEAHERSLNTDILFGLLKVLVKTRQPALRLVVTSATLESEKFSAYFNDCPVYHVPGRVYPVELAYATEQPKNYAETALETVMDLHCSQGRGDILLFLTGKEEIERTCRRLNERVREMPEDECPDMQVLPLYAALSPELQARVFAPPPAGCRRVVVATNLAETSLTVPGVVFVVDPGFTKQNEYDPTTGMDSLKVTSISAVQARQRAGRAGRTRAGRCFRLYTREHFELDMPTTTVPEIQRTSLVGTVLYLKTLRIEGLDVLDFDFLDKPDVEAMGDALRQLYALGAIDEDGAVTDLGREMSPLPVEPQLARAMLAARRFGCVDEMATVAAMLSVERVYTGNGPPREGEGDGDGDRRGPPPESLCSEHERRMGDHVVLMRTYQAWARGGHRRDFCERHGLSDRGMEFARDVRKQLLGAICVGFCNRLARRLPKHNGFRTLNDNAVLAEVHPSSARPLANEITGLLPEWIVYHELVATTRVFLRNVCAVEAPWVAPVTERLREVDLKRLSGGRVATRKAREEEARRERAKEAERQRIESGARRNDDKTVDDARARYLARKAAAEKAKK
ncbi:hypothetical protein MICPUN_97967 [Micromonas commoda]|uniref:RNA helicase n=1 Tax=Micromonas commoda (strain RCC299 / NOUM17 / CCMP2709) TaxID=296587 RepID=C1FH11_MICCC|nr:hypothetical protein MICPUN_97967 [Micromonas commoda]ACO70016.1 hypothetical protein MICPUN_97967 [Micromonas commoda]|eukprot:XP_002508758.1 hypothetical protein MICPUN_97967 [Micromonas commoda]